MIRERDERGAAMVEFALILPLLVLLTFGIIEFAVAFNTDSNINQAGRAGGRTAAILSTDPQMAFKAGAAAATSLDIAPGTVSFDTPPTVCVAKFNPAAPQQCTGPTATTMSLQHPSGPNNPTWVAINSNNDPPNGPYAINDNWAVNTRQFGCPSAGNPGSYDKVIIHIVMQHKLLVPGLFSEFFGNSANPSFTATAVFQLEPVPASSCG